MSHSGWASLDHPRRGRSRTRFESPRGRRTSTPGPNNESSSSEAFGDELTEFTYHFWMKALQSEDRRERKCVRSKTRHYPGDTAIPSSCSLRPATTSLSSVSLPNSLAADPASQTLFAAHLPDRRHYIMSHMYYPTENAASLVFIPPLPLYLPQPNIAFQCCPLVGYYENGTIGVIPHAYYCFYM